MENDTAVIREQMEHTRNSLTEKVEAIEERVSSVVKDTADAVNHTVQAVTESVENTVHSVSDSVHSVKDALDNTVHSVADSMHSVKEALDLSTYVEKYPWIAMGGSVALGYAVGCLLTSSKNGTTSSQAWSAPAPSPSGGTSQPAASSTSSGGSFLPESWMPMVDKLKGLAVGTAAGVLGEMVLNMVPESLKDNMARMIDETTEKLGGTVLRRDGHSTGNGFGR